MTTASSTNVTSVTTQEFFEQKYAQNADPWNFAGSSYELARYAAIVAALAGRRYRRAFEPGCSIGVLTAGLAELCDHVQAIDISATAVHVAQKRCHSLSNVHITCGSISSILIRDEIDLIVLSEIGYYFEAPELQTIVQNLLTHLKPGGVLLAAHWLGASADHILSGDEVHTVIGACDGLRLEHTERYPGFRLDRWRRV